MFSVHCQTGNMQNFPRQLYSLVHCALYVRCRTNFLKKDTFFPYFESVHTVHCLKNFLLRNLATLSTLKLFFDHFLTEIMLLWLSSHKKAKNNYYKTAFSRFYVFFNIRKQVLAVRMIQIFFGKLLKVSRVIKYFLLLFVVVLVGFFCLFFCYCCYLLLSVDVVIVC